MKILIIIAALLVVSVIVVLVIGILVIGSAADEMYRELDDLDQQAYIRRWQEEKERKKARKGGRKRKGEPRRSQVEGLNTRV